MNVGTITGRCLCGAITIEVGDAEHSVGACHCGMCQRWAGGMFMSFSAPPAAVTVTGDVQRYASSDFAERAFCPACGSHLWMRNTDRPNATYDLMPGLFAEAAGWPTRSEIYVDRAPAYAALAGAHRRTTAADYERGELSVEDDR